MVSSGSASSTGTPGEGKCCFGGCQGVGTGCVTECGPTPWRCTFAATTFVTTSSSTAMLICSPEGSSKTSTVDISLVSRSMLWLMETMEQVNTDHLGVGGGG